MLTGHDLKRQRIAAGMSARKVAKALDVSPMTLLRHEQSRAPLDAGTARRWTLALAIVASERLKEIERSGLAREELAGTPLAELAGVA